MRDVTSDRSAPLSAGAARRAPTCCATAPTARSTCRSPSRSSAYPTRLTDRCVHWAEVAPDRIFLAAARAPTATGAQSATRRRCTRARASPRRCSTASSRAERPVAILSDNDLEHALLGLAAMHVGVPYAPVSPAYSLMSQDYGKLQPILEHADAGPGVRRDGKRVRAAIAAAVPPGRRVVRQRPIRRPSGRPRLFADTAGDASRPTRSTPRTPRSGPTRSPSSCSPRARPGCPRA